MTRLVDPDLGRALSGGFHRPRVHVAAPDRPWTVPRTRAAVRRLLRGGPMTGAEIGDWLGLDVEQRHRLLLAALTGLARTGWIECFPGPPGHERPYSWRLRRRGQVSPDPNAGNTVSDAAGIPGWNTTGNALE